MDFDVINNLGYFEVIEISVWLGIMYFGKCWIDNFFKKEKQCYKVQEYMEIKHLSHASEEKEEKY